MATFNAAIDFVLDNEGGKVDNPHDPGGRTNFGITQRTYNGSRNKIYRYPVGGTVAIDRVQVGDVFDLTRDEAKEWYRDEVWGMRGLDQIDQQPIATKIFDAGVNMGFKTAVKLAQIAVGAYPDGSIGPNTLKALNSDPARDFLMKYVVLLKKHYLDLEQANPGLMVFDKGWMNRATKLPA